MLRLSSAHLGLTSRSVHVTFYTKSENSLSKIIALLPSKGFSAGNYSFQKENDGIRVKMVIRYRARRNDSGMVLHRLEKIPGIKLEKFE